MYCTGWCSALGVVGPYWSQLHEATMSWARVWRMRLGMEVGQLVAVVSPNPSMVRVSTVASPVAWSDGGDAVGGVVHDRVAEDHDRASGSAGDGAGASRIGCWPA